MFVANRVVLLRPAALIHSGAGIGRGSAPHSFFLLLIIANKVTAMKCARARVDVPGGQLTFVSDGRLRVCCKAWCGRRSTVWDRLGNAFWFIVTPSIASWARIVRGSQLCRTGSQR